jgi:hypothetical protein
MDIEKTLEQWNAQLVSQIDIAALYQRNKVAHSYKCLFRCFLIRETVFWRLNDLTRQSFQLHELGQALGARILLRSALETLALLIYVNQQMSCVLNGIVKFSDFSENTAKLVLGSKDGSSKHQAINILTVFKKCRDRYPAIEDIYNLLSESAHPNYEGMALGFTKLDRDRLIVNFSNRCASMFEASNQHGIESLIEIFQHEYNDVWTSNFELMETWIEQNAAKLGAKKSNS